MHKAVADREGFLPPLACSRERLVDILRPADTAIHAEVERSFEDDLSALGKFLGRNLAEAPRVVAEHLLKGRARPPGDAARQWLAQAPPAAHTILEELTGALMRSHPFSLARALRGRAVASDLLSYSADTLYRLGQAEQDLGNRGRLLDDGTFAKIDRIARMTPNARNDLEWILTTLLEARDGLFGHAQECKKANSLLSARFEGATIKEIIKDAGLAERLVGAQMLVRATTGSRMLPVRRSQ